MASHTLGLDIVVNADRARRDLAETGQAMGSLANKGKALGSELGSLANKGQAASGALSELARQVADTKSQLMAMAGAASAFEAFKSVVSLADEYKNLDAKLHLVTSSQAEFLSVQGKLRDMADANRQSLSATIDLYSGIAPSLQKVGRSQQELLTIVDSVNKALVVGGSTAQGSAASILQLTQALGSGVLRGDEFNSIMENGRGIAMMLADALHTDVGKLRLLAEQGKLTANVVTQALLEQHDAIATKFEKMPVTVGQALQVVKNNLLTTIGNFDEYTGATAHLSDLLLGLAKHLELVGAAGLALVAIYSGKLTSALAAYIATQYAAITSDTAKIASTRALQTAEAELAAARRALEAGYVAGNIAAVTSARAAETAALQNVATATRAVSVASAEASVVTRGLSAAMSMLGGPIGVLLLTIGGVVFALQKLQAEEKNAKDAIQLSTGEWVKNNDIKYRANELNKEYLTASPSRREEIKKEADELIDLGNAALKAAEDKLALLKSDKKGSLKYAQNELANAPINDLEDIDAQNSVLKSYKNEIDNTQKEIERLKNETKGATEAQKNLGKAGVDSAKDTAAGMINATNSTKKLTDELKRHAEALKGIKESLDEQRIALEHGTLAAKYYRDRLNDLTDAEARLSVQAGQYNTYLDERKKLQREAESLNGGLRTQYQQRLEDLGLDAGAMAGIDAVKGKADQAVASAKQLQAALDTVSEAAGNAGKSMSGAMASASDSATKATFAFADAIKAAASKYTNVPEALIRAVIKKETGWLGSAEKQATAVSPVGALGVMQVMPRTGIGLGYSASDLKDPGQNIMAGTKYLSGLMNQFGNDIAKVAAAYNAGPGAVQKFGGTPPYKETKDYVEKVTQYYKEYSQQVVTATSAATTAANTSAKAAMTLDKEAAGVHPQLIAVYQRANQLAQQSGEVGIKIIDGVRTAAEQAQNVANGASKTMNSRHLVAPNGYSHAVDLTIPYDGKQSNARDWEQVRKVNGYIKQASQELNVPVEWGGDWKSFKDGFHFQLPWKQFNGKEPAGNAPEWQKTQTAIQGADLASIKYNGTLAAGVVTEQNRNDLINQYMDTEANKLVKAANDHYNEVTKTGTEYRQLQLTQQQFNAGEQQAVMSAEQQAAFAAESKKLETERLGISGNLAKQYETELLKQNLTQQQIADLISGKMQNGMRSLTVEAEKQLQQIQLSATEYRMLDLSRQGYNAEMVQTVVQSEQLVNYSSSLKSIEEERATISGNMRTRLAIDLRKQVLSEAQINDLIEKRLQLESDKILYAGEQQLAQLALSAEAWRRIELEQQGYNAAQISAIINQDKLVERTKLLRDVSDNIGNALQESLVNAALGGQHAFDNLAETLQQTFKNLVLTPTIKPLNEAISRGIQGTLAGQANPWVSLQSTVAGMQKGGWQGAATSAGVASTLAGALGGNSAGAAIGAAIGNVILPGIGGAIGGALGGLIGNGKSKPQANFSADNGSTSWETGNSYAKSAFGTFGFTDAGTKSLSSEAEAGLAGIVQAMATLDNALASVTTAKETERIKVELANFSRSTTDFEQLIKDRLQITTSGLSEGFRSLIDFSQSAETIATRITDLIAVQQQAVPALQQMHLQIGATADAALITAAKLSDAAGGLNSLVTVSSAYYEAVYTEDERKKIAVETAQKTIDAFNAEHMTRIDSLASLRTYIESLDLTNASNHAASLAAMGLADELTTLKTAADEAASSAASAASATASPSVLEQAQAAKEQQDAVFAQFTWGLDKITSGLQRDLSKLEGVYADQKAAYEKAISAASGLREALTSLKTSDLTNLIPVQQLEAARAEFERLKALAASGDATAASGLQKAGETLLRLSREYNASSDAYNTDFSLVQGGWEQIAKLLEAQQDPAKAMLAAQQDLIDNAKAQTRDLASIFGGILGGNNLLTLLGTNIDNLPPEIAIALSDVLKGLTPNNPDNPVLTPTQDVELAVSKAKQYTDPTSQIIAVYQQLLNRPVDAAGLNYWLADLRNGKSLLDIATAITNSTEYKNSHALGLDRVPYDEYPAMLHEGEMVLDAGTANKLRTYGIPVKAQSANGAIIVKVDNSVHEATVRELQALRKEVAALRAERTQDADNASQQRAAQIHEHREANRSTQRAMRMKGNT